MPIHFRCPHCEKLLAIGTAKGGTQIHCPLCDRLITVPPRTEVNLPTTTVMPPDLAQSWWMDSPPVAAPNPKSPSETPAPSPPADAWWLTSNAPSPPSEKAIAAEPPPSVPPPLPETFVSPPSTEPPPDLLVFEPPTKVPPSVEQALREYGPESRSDSATRFFSPLHIGLLVGVVVISLLALAVLIVLLRGSEPKSAPPAEQPADKNRKDDKPARPPPSPNKPRSERSEDELRREAAAFPEVSGNAGRNTRPARLATFRGSVGDDASAKRR